MVKAENKNHKGINTLLKEYTPRPLPETQEEFIDLLINIQDRYIEVRGNSDYLIFIDFNKL